MDETAREEVTVLLGKLTDGNERVAAKLIPLVYDELRRLTGGHMRRERSDHTLEATALKPVEQRSVN